MITCSNCKNKAEFNYNMSETISIPYCAVHLPKFLKGKNAASLLVSKIETPAPEPAPTKKKTTKVVEPVVEESTEETVEEADGLN